MLRGASVTARLGFRFVNNFYTLHDYLILTSICLFNQMKRRYACHSAKERKGRTIIGSFHCACAGVSESPKTVGVSLRVRESPKFVGAPRAVNS